MGMEYLAICSIIFNVSGFIVTFVLNIIPGFVGALGINNYLKYLKKKEEKTKKVNLLYAGKN